MIYTAARGIRGAPGVPRTIVSVFLGAVLLAGADPVVQEVAIEQPRDERFAVLVDVLGRRVLVGSPDLVRSTFTRLVFLDGRFSPGFQPVDDRTGYDNERVRTWKVL